MFQKSNEDSKQPNDSKNNDKKHMFESSTDKENIIFLSDEESFPYNNLESTSVLRMNKFEDSKKRSNYFYKI